MANDYLKKEPTKNEKMLYQIAMAQQQMEKGLWSTSAHMVALGILTKVDPEEVAKILASGDDKIKEYSEKVNNAVKRIQEEKAKTDAKKDEAK